MDLLDRYLSAVRTFLPKAQQDDISNELSANIRSQMDDREEELGRPLNEAEQEVILQGYGHPMVVASRYQRNMGSFVFGRQLIGTTLFPFYVRVLWFTMGISLAIYLVAVIALNISGVPTTVGGMITTAVMQVAIQFAAITLIFATVEHYLPTIKWSAANLPTARPTVDRRQQVSRLESLGQIVGTVLIVAWLWFLASRPALLFGPAADTYRLGPIWLTVALPTLAVLLLSIAQAVVNLVRPDWTQLPQVTRLITDLGAVGVVVYLLRGTNWVVLANPNADSSSLSGINEFVYYGLLSTAIGFVLVAIYDAWRLIRRTRLRSV